VYLLVLAVALVAGRNWAFDLRETVSLDEQPVNPMCPPASTGAPEFSSVVHDIMLRDCYYYAISEGAELATAACIVDSVARVREGPIGGPLHDVSIAPTIAGSTMDRAALSPEGDHLVIRQYGAGPQRISWYARGPSGWVWESDIGETSDLSTGGAPSAGPDRRALHATSGGLRELHQAGGAWTELSITSWGTLGVAQGAQPHLSPDGLRLLFVAGDRVMYTDRLTIDSTFGPALEIETVGRTSNAFLVSDCARIFYGASGSIFFRWLVP
jgi:hypothetical protein